MEHETSTLPRPATAAVQPAPTPTELSAGTVTNPRTSPAPAPAAATLPDPAQPPERTGACDLDRLGDQIAELSARIDAATYELLCHLHEFDRQYGWEGFLSCAQWLHWRTGLSLGAAREKLRVAAALAELNHIPAAMACGKISYSKVRALTRIASPATEARLLAVACGANAAQVERLVRGWRQADREAQADGEQVRLANRMLSTQVDDNGMLVLRARLTPEVGAVLLHAVQAALEQVPASTAGDEATIAQRRADALGLVAESALAGGLDPGNPGDRFQVTVHVPVDTLASREPIVAAPPACAASPLPVGPAAHAASGTPDVSAETCEVNDGACARAAQAGNAQAGGRHAVSGTAAGVASAGGSGTPDVSAETCEVHGGACEPAAQAASLDAGQAVIEQAGGLHLGTAAARRIACDAGLVALRHGADGEVLDVGRKTRAVPTALRRALHVRDRSQCQFPGCDSRHCDAHHVVHWADGGDTRLRNLVLLCRFHHRAVHEEGFQVTVDAADGQFRFLRPDGVPLPAQRAAACWQGAPLAPTDARLAAAGVSIGPHTATPDWYGESLDLTAALDVLWEPPG